MRDAARKSCSFDTVRSLYDNSLITKDMEMKISLVLVEFFKNNKVEEKATHVKGVRDYMGYSRYRTGSD